MMLGEEEAREEEEFISGWLKYLVAAFVKRKFEIFFYRYNCYFHYGK